MSVSVSCVCVSVSVSVGVSRSLSLSVSVSVSVRYSSNSNGPQRRRAKLKNVQKWPRRKPALQSRPSRDQAIVMSDVEAYDVAHGKPFDWNLKEVGPLLHKLCRGSAGVKLKAVLKIDGFNAWRVLAIWF